MPTPKVRVAFAGIENSEDFGRRWKAWRNRLGLANTAAITVLADGAEGSWEEQRRHLRDAAGVLDNYPCVGALAHTCKAFQTHPHAREQRCEEARTQMLYNDSRSIEEFVQENTATFSEAQRPLSTRYWTTWPTTSST